MLNMWRVRMAQYTKMKVHRHRKSRYKPCPYSSTLIRYIRNKTNCTLKTYLLYPTYVTTMYPICTLNKNMLAYPH